MAEITSNHRWRLFCSCSRHNVRFDWLNCRALFSRDAHELITGLQIQGKKPYNKQLINLERSVLTGKSQTSACRIDRGIARYTRCQYADPGVGQ